MAPVTIRPVYEGDDDPRRGSRPIWERPAGAALMRTHIAPDRLELVDGRPPADALEVYFPTPHSLTFFGFTVADSADSEAAWMALGSIYRSLADGIEQSLQRAAGYVLHPSYRQRGPARLRLAAMPHRGVPGAEIDVWLHVHAWIAPEAVSLDDGRLYPVDIAHLRSVATESVYMGYLRDMETRTSAHGLEWAPLPGRHPADRELNDSFYTEHIDLYPAPHEIACPPVAGQRIMADEAVRKDFLEYRRRHAS